MRILSDLNLHGDRATRLQPELGEWGPESVMPTRRKKLTRWLWLIAFVVIAALLILFGSWVYAQVMASGG
ncbi:MAG: hypothetical protein LBV30_04550 [Propionibacteriaceae bacterium]|nr:hypothetical protein [Propionibacteriaceae bacterium]